jgi:streptogramin lyase
VWFEQELVGTVAHFNPSSKILKVEKMRVEPGSAYRGHPAFHIHEDSHGTTWVHPYGGGFSYFDRKSNSLIPFYDDLDSPDWRFSNKMHAAFSDRQGNLWLCSHSKGLEKVTFLTTQFHLNTPVKHNYESLSNDVRALFQDKEGNLWAGFKDGMLRVYNSKQQYLGYLTEQGTIAQSGTPLKGSTYA